MTPEYVLTQSLCRPAWCNDSPQRLRDAQRAIECLDWAPGYAEPGYQDPERAVLFSNWNHFPVDATRLLERYGYEVEWDDEWSTCGECGKAVRTQADSWGWQPYYIILNECELVCLDCVDWPDVLRREYENNSSSAVPSRCNLRKHGYKLLDSGYESGFYGTRDNPGKIFKELAKEGHRNLVFRISGKGQFAINFEVWERA